MAFKDLVGVNIPLTLIENGLRNDNLSPSLLFHGPPSSGKLSLALALAKAVNCQVREKDFCDNCDSCRKIRNLTHPDVILLNSRPVMDKVSILHRRFCDEPGPVLFNNLLNYLEHVFYNFESGRFAVKKSKTSEKGVSDLAEKIGEFRQSYGTLRDELGQSGLSPKLEKKTNQGVKLAETISELLISDNIPIDTVRQLVKRLYVKPMEGERKVIIINGLENMRAEAANTFLKGIEEPPPGNIIVLIAENIDQILPTIRSRCFLLPFMPRDAESKRHILEERFGILVPDSKNIGETIWEMLKTGSESGVMESLVSELLAGIAGSYQRNGDLFPFVDKVVATGDLPGFFRALSETLRKSKRMKYGVDAVDDRENPFRVFPDIAIDRMVREGSELLPRVEGHNLNASIQLSSYLLKLSKNYQMARKRLAEL